MPAYSFLNGQLEGPIVVGGPAVLDGQVIGVIQGVTAEIAMVSVPEETLTQATVLQLRVRQLDAYALESERASLEIRSLIDVLYPPATVWEMLDED